MAGRELISISTHLARSSNCSLFMEQGKCGGAFFLFSTAKPGGKKGGHSEDARPGERCSRPALTRRGITDVERDCSATA